MAREKGRGKAEVLERAPEGRAALSEIHGNPEVVLRDPGMVSGGLCQGVGGAADLMESFSSVL